MPPGAAAVAAASQQADCCGHGPSWRGGGGCDVPGGASCSYLPLRKRLSVDGKFPAPRICIWECDGEAGDITCDIVAAPLSRSCSARAMPPPSPASLFRRMMRPPPSRPRQPQGVVEDDVAARRPGETISKGHRSYGLMLNLQLGIRYQCSLCYVSVCPFLGIRCVSVLLWYSCRSYSVGKSSALPFRKLSSSDFDPREKVWTRFPPEGSKLTPPHHSVDFRWKDYCPAVFRCQTIALLPVDFGHLEKNVNGLCAWIHCLTAM